MFAAAGQAWAQLDVDMGPSYSYAAIDYSLLEKVGGNEPRTDGAHFGMSFRFGESIVLQGGFGRLETETFDFGAGPQSFRSDSTDASLSWLYAARPDSDFYVRLGGEWITVTDSINGETSDAALVGGLGWRSRPLKRLSYDTEFIYGSRFSLRRWDFAAGLQVYMTPAMALNLRWVTSLNNEADDVCTDAGNSGCKTPDRYVLGLLFDFGGGKGMGFERD